MLASAFCSCLHIYSRQAIVESCMFLPHHLCISILLALASWSRRHHHTHANADVVDLSSHRSNSWEGGCRPGMRSNEGCKLLIKPCRLLSAGRHTSAVLSPLLTGEGMDGDGLEKSLCCSRASPSWYLHTTLPPPAAGLAYYLSPVYRVPDTPGLPAYEGDEPP